MASQTETSRPPKGQRMKDPSTPDKHVIRVTTTKIQEDTGLSVLEHKLDQGYTIVPKSERLGGRSVLLEMPYEKYKTEIYDVAKKRSRALQGLKRSENLEKGGTLSDVSIGAEQFTGKDVADAAMSAAHKAAQDDNG